VRADGVAAGLAMGMVSPIVSASDAAVAKLQTRSPAVMHRRLGAPRKESVAAHPLHTASPTPVLPTALAMPAPAETQAPEAHTHASIAGGPKPPPFAPGSAPQLQAAELSMPFKLRDFLLCILRQLYRMQEVEAAQRANAANADAALP